MKVSDARTDCSCDELAVPSSGDFVCYVSFFVCDIPADLVCIATAPTARLKGQHTLVTGSVVGDLQKNDKICCTETR